jgi:hypothetical protein
MTQLQARQQLEFSKVPLACRYMSRYIWLPRYLVFNAGSVQPPDSTEVPERDSGVKSLTTFSSACVSTLHLPPFDV